MEKDKKALLIRYIVCFCVACGMVLGVFALKGFFTGNAKDNMQLLHDAFFTAGILMVLFSGMLFVAGEGAFLGIGYVLERAFKALIPLGRREHESYAQYRERKLGKKKANSGTPIFLTGLLFVVVSVVFLIIWYQM